MAKSAQFIEGIVALLQIRFMVSEFLVEDCVL